MIDMAMKKVKRIEKETSLFCLDDCIATLAGYYQCDYEMMYIGGYQVSRQQGIQDFAEWYDIWLRGRFDNLQKYHGIMIQKYDFYWKHRVIRKIREELDGGRPVLLLLNPFWCPWDDGFQKYDAVPGHCFLIKGEYDGGFLCVDPYFEKDGQELPFAMFRKGLQEVYLTGKQEIRETSAGEERRTLERMYQSLSETAYFDLLRSFIIDMDQNGNIFQGVRMDADFWISPLIVFLLKINQSMQNIATVTAYVAGRCQSLSLQARGEKLWNIAVKWKQARKLVIKLYFIKRQDEKLKARTVERLMSIIDEMEEAVSEVPEEPAGETLAEELACCGDTGSGKPGSGQVVLDLKEYMNNKAFLRQSALEKGEREADFSSIGHCYVLDDTEGFHVLHTRERKIPLPEAGQPGNDNIACNGQVIALPQGRYSQVILIGSAEFGNSSDIMKIVSAAGREYEVEFCFTDYICEPFFGESIAWKGRGIYKKDHGYEWMPEDLYLYEQRLTMPEDTICEMILPINPSVHLFAIVLIL